MKITPEATTITSPGQASVLSFGLTALAGLRPPSCAPDPELLDVLNQVNAFSDGLLGPELSLNGPLNKAFAALAVYETVGLLPSLPDSPLKQKLKPVARKMQVNLDIASRAMAQDRIY